MFWIKLSRQLEDSITKKTWTGLQQFQHISHKVLEPVFKGGWFHANLEKGTWNMVWGRLKAIGWGLCTRSQGIRNETWKDVLKQESEGFQRKFERSKQIMNMKWERAQSAVSYKAPCASPLLTNAYSNYYTVWLPACQLISAPRVHCWQLAHRRYGHCQLIRKHTCRRCSAPCAGPLLKDYTPQIWAGHRSKVQMVLVSDPDWRPHKTRWPAGQKW